MAPLLYIPLKNRFGYTHIIKRLLQNGKSVNNHAAIPAY